MMVAPITRGARVTEKKDVYGRRARKMDGQDEPEKGKIWMEVAPNTQDRGTKCVISR